MPELSSIDMHPLFMFIVFVATAAFTGWQIQCSIDNHHCQIEDGHIFIHAGTCALSKILQTTIKKNGELSLMELARKKSALHATLHQHLDVCPLFSQWSSLQKIQLVESAKEIHLLSGETLFCRGEMEMRLYLLLSGSVKGVLLSEEGNEAIIDLAGTGQWFGGLNILDERPHNYSAVALEPTLCMSFDGALIKRTVESNPVLYREVAHLLCERLRAQSNWVEENLLWPVKKRIVIRMEHMASRCGTQFEDGLIIQTRISQDVLASMLGVTRQTLNKELKELKQSGVIRKIGSHYWIKQKSPVAV